MRADINELSVWYNISVDWGSRNERYDFSTCKQNFDLGWNVQFSFVQKKISLLWEWSFHACLLNEYKDKKKVRPMSITFRDNENTTLKEELIIAHMIALHIFYRSLVTCVGQTGSFGNEPRKKKQKLYFFSNHSPWSLTHFSIIDQSKIILFQGSPNHGSNILYLENFERVNLL